MGRTVNHSTNNAIDLLSGEFYAGDPHNAWTWMRENAPVYYDERNDVWGLASYDHVLAASKDQPTFSSVQGVRPRQSQPSDNMIDKDDPEHKARRSLVNRGFTPGRIRDKTTAIREMCDQIIDQVCEQGSCDFVWDIAAPLPLLLIGDMLGFERSMSDQLLTWSDDLLRALKVDPSDELVTAQLMAALGFREYQMGVIADRRARPPQEDLVSILCHAEIDGKRLDDEALVMEALLILIGGDETTRHVISGGMLALLENPTQLERLTSGAVDLDIAVEEMLRWVTPIKNMNRTATRDVDVGGQTIAQGDQVLLLYPSANRDSKYFDAPFDFDVGRQPNHHLAFGFGSHFCLGNALARLELKIMFEAVFERLPDLRLADDAALPLRPANFVSGLESMPVVFTPSAPKLR